MKYFSPGASVERVPRRKPGIESRSGMCSWECQSSNSERTSGAMSHHIAIAACPSIVGASPAARNDKSQAGASHQDDAGERDAVGELAEDQPTQDQDHQELRIAEGREQRRRRERMSADQQKVADCAQDAD